MQQQRFRITFGLVTRVNRAGEGAHDAGLQMLLVLRELSEVAPDWMAAKGGVRHPGTVAGFNRLRCGGGGFEPLLCASWAHTG